MPYDNKRINGPDSSISYQYHSKANLKTYEDKLKELFQQENELRIDGRKNTEARKMCTYIPNLKINFVIWRRQH